MYGKNSTMMRTLFEYNVLGYEGALTASLLYGPRHSPSGNTELWHKLFKASFKKCLCPSMLLTL
jgi:hypothetical protein